MKKTVSANICQGIKSPCDIAAPTVRNFSKGSDLTKGMNRAFMRVNRSSLVMNVEGLSRTEEA